MIGAEWVKWDLDDDATYPEEETTVVLLWVCGGYRLGTVTNEGLWYSEEHDLLDDLDEDSEVFWHPLPSKPSASNSLPLFGEGVDG